MPQFPNVRLIAAALPCLLAACAAAPNSGGAQAKAGTDPGCTVQSLTHRFRAGSNIQMVMHVENTGRWCFDGLSILGATTSGTRVIDQPAHGELRLMVRDAGVAFGYRPRANYAGADQFVFRMPSGFGGYDTNVSVSVHVTPIVTVAPG